MHAGARAEGWAPSSFVFQYMGSRRLHDGRGRASREGELDLDDPKIWTQYYNKPEDYHALREIKRKLDPDDLFHSKFTLRPAEH